MDQKHRGAFSECIAIAALLELGFDVFQNVSQHGKADLVAVNFLTGETYLIDVKTAHNGERGPEIGKRYLTQEQIEFGVNLIEVTHDGKIVWSDRVAINANSLYQKKKGGVRSEPEQRENPRPAVRGKPVLKVYEGTGGRVPRGS